LGDTGNTDHPTRVTGRGSSSLRPAADNRRACGQPPGCGGGRHPRPWAARGVLVDAANLTTALTCGVT